ncbi:MAG: GntR family transcriptional regulator [Proteobacteria bacterium]|nr:GntR family transcriptional regulator [Pseudomonadota bacterium]
MVEIGRTNSLRVVKEVEFGLYLDGEDLGEILMPKRYMPKGCKPDDVIEVFLYLDSEDRLVATSEKPYAEVGDFACMKVVDVAEVGAFLDWGLPKDLLVPFREQKEKMSKGKEYVVFVYLDNSERIAASSRLDRFLSKEPPSFEEGEEVELLICEETDMGYKAIINGDQGGVLYSNEVFQKLKIGEKTRGFIKKIRDDGKVDLSLQKAGAEKVDELSEKILSALKEQGGFLYVTDKSLPKVINTLFGCSKKTYKKAIGGLYKKRLITIEDKGIRLCEKSE